MHEGKQTSWSVGPATCLIFILWLSRVQAGLPAEIHTLDGELFRGEIVEFQAEGQWVYSVEGELNYLDASEIHSIYFAPESLEDRTQFSAGIELVEGSFLGGELEGGEGENLRFRHPVLGRFAMPVDWVSKLVLAKPSLPQDFERHDQREENDVLFKTGIGVRGRDFITGILESFSERGLVFDCALGRLEFKFEDIEALTLAQSEDHAEKKGKRVQIDFFRALIRPQ